MIFKANMMFIWLIFGMTVIGTQGGSQCPERRVIYPCVCLNSKLRAQQDTTVACHRLLAIEEFLSVVPILDRMYIDHFILCDGFITAETYNALNPEANLDIIRQFKEVDIVDTIIPPKAFCGPLSCSRSILTRLSLYNTSFGTDTFKNCLVKDTDPIKGIRCLANLVELHIVEATNFRDLKHAYFQDPLTALQVFNVSRAYVSHVDKNFFTSAVFPKLKKVDLSHNRISDASHMFSQAPMTIEYIDLSYNMIKTGIRLSKLKNLKILKLKRNNILTLRSSDWDTIPKLLHHLDLTVNEIKCDCNTLSINATFPTHTHILGTCHDSGDYTGLKLRKASKMLKPQCQKKKSAN